MWIFLYTLDCKRTFLPVSSLFLASLTCRSIFDVSNRRWLSVSYTTILISLHFFYLMYFVFLILFSSFSVFSCISYSLRWLFYTFFVRQIHKSPFLWNQLLGSITFLWWCHICIILWCLCSLTVVSEHLWKQTPLQSSWLVPWDKNLLSVSWADGFIHNCCCEAYMGGSFCCRFLMASTICGLVTGSWAGMDGSFLVPGGCDCLLYLVQ